MFLEIKGIKKSFGTGDSRVNVLKGFDREEAVPVPEKASGLYIPDVQFDSKPDT